MSDIRDPQITQKEKEHVSRKDAKALRGKEGPQITPVPSPRATPVELPEGSGSTGQAGQAQINEANNPKPQKPIRRLRRNDLMHMKQIIQNLKTGKTILEELPAPQVKAGQVQIQTSRSLVSLGTEQKPIRRLRRLSQIRR